MPLMMHAQSSLSRYIVELTDKKQSLYTTADPVPYLSAASIQRRAKQHIPIDSTDLPISSAYLDSIASVPNVTILNRSKWLNQVLIKTTDPAALATLQAFSFVRQTVPIAAAANVVPQTGQAKKFTEHVGPALSGLQGKVSTPGKGRIKTIIKLEQAGIPSMAEPEGNLLSYGNSFAQIHIHHGEYLHNLGFRGQGITIAVLDGGFFGWLSNPALDSVRSNDQVLGSWDFVNNKQSVNEEDIHGFYCLSIMAANRPGQLVGSAPGAKFWLLKTEDVNSEYPVEEQNWAAAAEFADSAGADMITTSLSYVNFDDAALNHSYAERDGHTAISTRAANFAVGKGMIVLAAAGNSGGNMDDTKYVGCPGDADSALTVGATDDEGRIAAFSSWGPNSAGRIKPDAVSVGVATVVAAADGSPATGSGTSFATPNLAGLVACLWEAFPEFNNHTILDAIRQSSSNYPAPNGRYGYGLPDLQKAYELLEEIRGVNAIVSRGSPRITAFPVPYSDEFTVVFQAQHNGNAGLALIDAMGRTIVRQALVTFTGQWYTVHFSSAGNLSGGVYFIRYTDGQQQTVLPVIRK
jgi:serine protease AprX